MAKLPYIYSGAVLKQRRKWSITSVLHQHAGRHLRANTPRGTLCRGTLGGRTLFVKHYYIVVKHTVLRSVLDGSSSSGQTPRNVASEENIPATRLNQLAAEYKRLPSSKSKSSSCSFTNLQHKSGIAFNKLLHSLILAVSS